MIYPAIVIPAYNRPRCLQRLLQGVAGAHYPAGQSITLVISIDTSGSNDVAEVAEGFEWLFGQKIIVKHPAHLGLLRHILYCGNLSKTYGSIALLEDDLLVSAYFYHYACMALGYYHSDARIAGISLYHYEIAENGYYPFLPLDDGSDVYFMQVASSWGQAWTAAQWAAFADWLKANPFSANPAFPDYLQEWSDQSWKKRFIGYLMQTGKYFVFPRLSLTTNTGEPGTHAITKGLYQTPLQMAAKNYRFISLEESGAIYDAFFELLPHCLNRFCPHLAPYSYTTDLYATKTTAQITTPYVLTTRAVTRAVATYGLQMLPNVLNVVYNQPGATIKLAPVTALLPAALPPYRQYYRLLAVAPAIFNPMSRQPLISIVLPVYEHKAAELLQTLQLLLGQYYPALQLIFVGIEQAVTTNWFAAHIEPHLLNVYQTLFIPCNANQKETLAHCLWHGLRRSAGEVVAFATHTAVTYQPYCLNMAAQIFSGFGQVNWLLATHSPHHHITDATTSLPQYRWTKDRFGKASATQLHRFFKPEFQLFRRFMLLNAAQAVFDELGEQGANTSADLFCLLLCKHLFNTHEPVSVFRPIALLPPTANGAVLLHNFTQTTDHKPMIQTPKKWISAVVKPFYLSDIPYLRYLYTELANLPPVVRYHPPTQSYYLSRF